VRPFKDGFAMIEKGIYWSVINENHKTVVPFSRKYQQISEFNDGIAFVKLDTKWGAINTKGDIVIPVKYYEIEKFICGIARMRLKPKLYGYIDMNGNEVIQPIYEMLSIPQFGVIAYLHNHKWGLMDTSGNIILESAYDYIQTFNNSGFAVAAIYNRPVNLTSYPRKKGLPLGIFDGKYGIIDTSGNTIVDLNYDYISDINDDDLAIVMINGKFGMINIKGDVVIEPIYHHCDTVIEKYHEMIERQ
jgi:hypothetical protein